MKLFKDIGLKVPNILLPNKDIDYTKWAVVACDQYTSEPDYWNEVERIVGDSPSTLKIIFPEIYLEADDAEKRILNINNTMEEYVAKNILEELGDGFILVDRKTSQAESRKGLIVALDLEEYDYTKGSSSLIRATEGTIIDRLPPRIKVRENALIESPHIMVLIDDPEKTVIEPLFNKKLEKIYDFELMQNSGHLKGYKVTDTELIEEIATKLSDLADKKAFEEKYNAKDKAVLLYAMGDGNHSFATAKAIWEKKKESADNKDEIMNDPARFALVELVNIHDSGLEFEAIHRVVFDIEIDDMLRKMKTFYEKSGSEFSFFAKDNCGKLNAPEIDDAHVISFITNKWSGYIIIKKPNLTLEVATLQSFLDEYLKEKENSKIDYIHGDDVVTKLGSESDNVGFYLPAISKHSLFKTIIFDGALPRKTFSMGEADEKRFYLECRKIK
jgi:uncharacterized protein (DUF1015 family)